MIHYQAHGVTVHHGDALAVLATLPDNSIDAVVTDPPYGLEFMGKEWDAPWTEPDINADAGFRGGGISATRGLPSFTGSTNPKCLDCKGTRRGRRDGTAKVAVCLCSDGGRFPNVRAIEMAAFQQWCTAWAAECLRVLKPGGHLLAFGGTRTAHRLTAGIEDAGFEIRDSVAWLYGSGFPKSLDVSKSIDKSHGTDRDRQLEFTTWMRSTGITARQIDDATGTNMGGRYLSAASQPSIATADMFDRLRHLLPPVPEHIERLVAERTGIEWTDYVKRPKIGTRLAPVGHAFAGATYGGDSSNVDVDITAPATPEAARWAGFGTALKPAHEPVTVARKPLRGTVAANVLAWGTGAINIDAGRIGTEVRTAAYTSFKPVHGNRLGAPGTAEARRGTQGEPKSYTGRWPANVALDEAAAAELDEQSGESASRVGVPRGSAAPGDGWGMTATGAEYADAVGASRFLYVAKADADERPRVNGTSHPTIKPLALMRWLVRMFTPPGGVVLDPFAGSGTTAEACLLERFRCVTIEREADYLPFVVARVTRQRDPVAHVRLTGDDNPTLFDEEG